MEKNRPAAPPQTAPGTLQRRPEILAPAGDPLSFRAALATGADAVYLGMASKFNARGRAEKFRGYTLEACIRAAHARGVRVYVTLNTLIHDDELGAALALGREALDAGADAAIVQDAGFAAVLREVLPDLVLHGSTQMSLHQGTQAAEAVARLGLRRVILARECSVDEIRAVAQRLRPLGAGVEVFVHGALCFAYSGQCLMSNFAGRRSANRGICAQNCRFDFTAGPEAPGGSGSPCAKVAADPAIIPIPAFRPKEATQLISMKDLAAFESIASLADCGVEAFKIEGRLKGPDYVAEVVRLYRAALDAWEGGRPFSQEEALRAAGRVYSRGFTNGYLSGRIEASMRGDKRSLEGEPDAMVLQANRKTGILIAEPRAGHAIRAGQGYRYAHDRYRGGFRVLSVDPAPTGAAGTRDPDGPAQPWDLGSGRPVQLRVRFGSEASGRRYRRGARGRRSLPPPLPVGLALHLNDDPELEKRIGTLVGTVQIEAGRPPAAVRISVAGSSGGPLTARASTADGRAAEISSVILLEAARSRALDGPLLQEHLGRLGGTGYQLSDLDASALAPGVFLGFPALHDLRRRIVASLDAQALETKARAPAAPAAGAPAFTLPAGEAHRVRTELTVIIGSPEALHAARAAGAGRVIVEDGLLIAGDAQRLSAWTGALAGAAQAWLRLPPVVHNPQSDQEALARLAGHFPHCGIVAGHLGQIALAREAGLETAADFHLNAYNHRTIRFLAGAGACRVTLSLEVDAGEAARVAARATGVETEVVAGGSVFSMLTRQDYGLQRGGRFTAVSEHGHLYRFETSPAGITTLAEARELVGASALPILAGSVDSVRLDLAHLGAAAVGEIAAAYREALEALLETGGGASGSGDGPPQGAAAGAVQRALEVHRRHAPAGHFEGHLFRGARVFDTEA